MLDSDVDENLEDPIEEDLESDREDSDFIRDKDEEFDKVSLDKESDEDHMLDELDLEVDIEQMMILRQHNRDANAGCDCKIVKVFTQVKFWSRHRDGTMSLKKGDTFTCKEDLLIFIKDFHMKQGTRKVRNSRRRYI